MLLHRWGRVTETFNVLWKVTRKGKRIEMAKVAFGTRHPNEREQTAPPITAVERRLASMEIDSSLASHLIQRKLDLPVLSDWECP